MEIKYSLPCSLDCEALEVLHKFGCKVIDTSICYEYLYYKDAGSKLDTLNLTCLEGYFNALTQLMKGVQETNICNTDTVLLRVHKISEHEYTVSNLLSSEVLIYNINIDTGCSTVYCRIPVMDDRTPVYNSIFHFIDDLDKEKKNGMIDWENLYILAFSCTGEYKAVMSPYYWDNNIGFYWKNLEWRDV